MADNKIYSKDNTEIYKIIDQLPPPFNTILIEQKPGDYKDFHIKEGDPYPLKGVLFPVNYGFLPGYSGEDTHPLDFFVGTDPTGKIGYLMMERPDLGEHIAEHKFYIAMTPDEVEKVMLIFKPVLAGSKQYAELSELEESTQPFKDI